MFRQRSSIVTASIATLLVALLATAPGGASAAIVSVTASTQPFLINTDLPTVVGKDPGDSVLRVWDEQQDLTLTGDLAVNLLASTGAAGVLSAGTIINSYMIQWDGPNSGPRDYVSADINFDAEILAIIYKTKTLKATDTLLGTDGLVYKSFTLRGLESSDARVISDDLMTLSIDWNTSSPGDWARVITAIPVIIVPPPTGDDDDDDDDINVTIPVPTPGALPAGLILMGATMLRRRKRG